MLKPTELPQGPEEEPPAESIMSVDDLVEFGLEPGQRALVWDFASRRYVAVMKSARPLLDRMFALAQPAVHTFVVAVAAGGLMQ